MYTIQESVEEIKSNFQVYNTQESREEIKNNYLVITT